MTLAQLLVVQAHDTAIDQLTHRRQNLPEYAALAMIDDERAHLERERSVLESDRHGFDRDQKRLEDDVALIEDRHQLESTRLYSGTVTAIKDLEAIQHELVTLQKRQRKLEDQVLEIMESADPINAGIAEIDTKLAEVSSRRDQVSDSLAAAVAAIDDELARERQMRVEGAASVDPDLMAEYEKARALCGGVGASLLVDKHCEGCRLQLAAVDLDQIRKLPADAIAWCDCGRILVRK